MASVSQIRRMMQMATPHQETVTDDAVASFVTDFPAPARVTAEFSPVQAGSGDPSPDNVRPISGWTDANIYNEETYDASATPKLTINWQSSAGTVYGGYIQLNEDGSGVLVADHKLFTWSSGFVPSLDSTEAKHIFSTRRPSDFAQTSVENWGKKYYSNILSLTSRGSSSSNMVDGSIYAGSSYLQMRIDSVANTQDAIDALLTATPLQIVAPLVTPLTYSLSADQLRTLLGENCVFSNLNSSVTVRFFKHG